MSNPRKKMPPVLSLLADAGQPGLALPDEDAVLVQTLEADGDYTAERLFAQRPKVYRLVVQLLARCWGTQKISDTVRATGDRLSKNTVKAVRAREGGTIEAVKAQLSARSFDLADQSFEAASIIVDEVMSDPLRRKKLTVKDASALAVIGGIAVQNGQLLTGQPTIRVEVTEVPKPAHDDFNEYLKSLPSANPPTTHLVAETAGQKEGEKTGGARADGPAARAEGDPGAVAAGTDLQSKV